MSLFLTRRGEAALIAADGQLGCPGTLETVAGAFDFVPIDDDVILDLSRVDEITESEAEHVTQMVRSTSHERTVVVVVCREADRAELALSGLDEVARVVPRPDDAVDLLRRGRARRQSPRSTPSEST